MYPNGDVKYKIGWFQLTKLNGYAKVYCPQTNEFMRAFDYNIGIGFFKNDRKIKETDIENDPDWDKDQLYAKEFNEE